MEKMVFDITYSLRNQKQWFTETDVRDIDGSFFIKLCGLKIDYHIFNTKLPLNEDDNNLKNNLMMSITRETLEDT